MAGLLATTLMAGVAWPAHAQVFGEILVGMTALPVGGVALGPVPAAGAVVEPSPVDLPLPEYPDAARAAGREGRVLVCFTVDENGAVHTPVIRSSTDTVFNHPAVDAIRNARFTAARVGTEAVRSTACRAFKFVLR